MASARDDNESRGKLIVISGPSGVGKSTITRAIVARLEEAYLSVSLTTRPQAPGEEDGREYWFVSDEEFRRQIDEGRLLEHAEVFGNLYGTSRDKTEEALNAGKTVILEIDIQGARQVKEIYRRAAMVFILPPSAKVLEDRIGRRGRESTEAALRRLSSAGDEIATAWKCYDHMVINDDLEQAIQEVLQIVRDAPCIDEESKTDQPDMGDE